MWDIPRNQLWMALPCWEQITSAHVRLLDEIGLKIWLAILTECSSPKPYPVLRFFFLPDQANSNLSCREGFSLQTEFIETATTQVCLNGEWLAEFDNAHILSIGTGAVVLDVLDEQGSVRGFGKAQRGFVEFGEILTCRGWIKRASIKQFLDLTGQTILSDRTMVEFSSLVPLNSADESLSSLLYGPHGSLSFSEIALSARRAAVNVASSRPTLLLRGYGQQKVAVVRLLMNQFNETASEIMGRVGKLVEPFQIASTDPYDIGSLLDLADDYTAIGADVYVGASV